MKMVALGDIASFVRGVTYKPADLRDDGVGVMRTKNVQSSLDLSDTVRVDPRIIKRESQYLLHGDILVSSANSWNLVGKACWIPELPEPLAIGGFVTALRANTSAVHPRYLYRWFTSPQTQARLRSFSNRTTSISNLNLTRASEMLLPLPDTAEQKRLTKILDRSEELSQVRQEVTSKIRELPASLFLELFGDPSTNPEGWPTSRLGDLALKFSDGPFGSNLKSSHYVSSGVRVVRLQNIGNGRFVDDDAAYISEDHFSKLGKHECRPGDLLIGTLGDPNLRACIQPASLPLAINKADCVQMRVDPDCAHASWACWLLNSTGTFRMASSMVHGQTRTRLPMGLLRELKVPVPPLDMQQSFARQVASISDEQAKADRALQLTGDLFSSLQGRAFQGEL